MRTWLTRLVAMAVMVAMLSIMAASAAFAVSSFGVGCSFGSGTTSNVGACNVDVSSFGGGSSGMGVGGGSAGF